MNYKKVEIKWKWINKWENEKWENEKDFCQNCVLGLQC